MAIVCQIDYDDVHQQNEIDGHRGKTNSSHSGSFGKTVLEEDKSQEMSDSRKEAKTSSNAEVV